MKPSELLSALRATTATRRAAFVWGKPGLGKSDLIRQLCQEMGLPVIDFRAIYRDPVDMRGIPTIVGGRTHYCPPDDLPDGPSILFLDELNSAPQATQAACYHSWCWIGGSATTCCRTPAGSSRRATASRIAG